MLIPQILPDEFARGYQTRLRIVNGYRDNESLMAALQSNTRRSITDQTVIPGIAAIAHHLDTDCAELVCRHSMIPFIRAVVSQSVDQAHGDPAGVQRLVRFGFREIRGTAHYCQACVAEDLDFRGIPYWRRSHQIPGMDWCPKHGQVLITAERTLFETLPPTLPTRTDPHDGTEEFEHPIIRRYAEIALGLMDLKKPLLSSDTGRILGNAARALGLRVSPKGRRSLPSDLAREHLPITWLARHFPLVANKPRLDYIGNFDGVCAPRNASFRAEAYALLAALLYPSADEALFALTHLERCPPPKTVPSRSTLVQDNRRNRQLTNAYIESDGIPAGAARMLTAEPKNISRKLCEIGLPALTGVDEETRTALLAFLQGASLDQVSMERGIDVGVLQNLLRAACLPLRSALETMKNKRPPTKPSVH